MSIEQSLFLALSEEHKQRTGHDVFKQSSINPTWLRCNVCLYLDRVKRDYELGEAEYYRQQQEIAERANQSMEADARAGGGEDGKGTPA